MLRASGEGAVPSLPLAAEVPFKVVVDGLLQKFGSSRRLLMDSDPSFCRRSFEGWMAGERLPNDEHLRALRRALVRIGNEAGADCDERKIDLLLRGARAGQVAKEKLTAFLGEEAWRDLVDGFRHLTERALSVLGEGALVPRYLLASANNSIDESQRIVADAHWHKPSKDVVAVAHELPELISLGLCPRLPKG